FPGASSSAFAFENGYVGTDTLENGRGYWMKFPQAQTIVMNGTALDAETVDVAADWNMVGSLSTPVDASTISSIPGGIVTSGFYQFDGSYQQSSILLPGRGYWVKSSQAGQFVFSSIGNTPTAGRIRIEDRGELPPPPPVLSDGITGEKPREYRLNQNSPNPFNPTTTLSYTLPSKVHVTLRVYDLLGRVMTTLVDKVEEGGEHRVRWDADGIPSGIYFYRLVAGDYTRTLKMVVMK
ncbi:MAG TPA: T9SS type A sorting domain-containing protein, partial [Bacteroidota bacterium]|nr:T9SS type A sorting domain-containing protein [Bacteroidota bacterium]